MSILLLLAFGSLGSGALRYLHELEHAAAHARAAGAGEGAHAAAEPAHEGDHEHDHDHSPLGDRDGCFTHAQLKLPMIQGGSVPPLACLGLFVAFVSTFPEPAIRSRRPVLRLDCRAPPAR